MFRRGGFYKEGTPVNPVRVNIHCFEQEFPVSLSPIVALADQIDVIDEEISSAPAVLLDVFNSVPDPRKRRGIRHSLTGILVICVCAVLAGARSFAAIAEWAKDTPASVLADLGIGIPHATTIGRVLAVLDAQHFDSAISTWVTGRTKPRVIAVDGKEIRGAKNGGQTRVHLLAGLDHATGTVVGQVNVEEKTNEIPMFSALLDTISDLDGVIVTADAMHTQRCHAIYLHDRGGHYVLTVKANQPTLHKQLQALPWKNTLTGDSEHSRGHGRVSVRSIKVIPIEPGTLFPHAAQAIQLTRQTRPLAGKEWAVETVYAVTSLADDHANPAQLNTWIRNHWGIENRLHWVRDVTFAEDHSQIRTGNAPRIMASLRNLAISIYRMGNITNIAQAIRHTARNPHRALQTAEIITH